MVHSGINAAMCFHFTDGETETWNDELATSTRQEVAELKCELAEAAVPWHLHS